MSQLIILEKEKEETTYAVGDVATVKTGEIPEKLEELQKKEFEEVSITLEETEKVFCENVQAIESEYEAKLGGAKEDATEEKRNAETMMFSTIDVAKERFNEAVKEAGNAFAAAVHEATREFERACIEADKHLEEAKEAAFEAKEAALTKANDAYDAAKASIEKIEDEKAAHEKELHVFEALNAAPVTEEEKKEEVKAPVVETPVVTQKPRIRF